jgi:hypothetical protein
MAHEKKKSSTGNWKGKRDKHQKADRLNSDKKKEEPLLGWHLWSPPKKRIKCLYFES